MIRGADLADRDALGRQTLKLARGDVSQSLREQFLRLLPAPHFELSCEGTEDRVSRRYLRRTADGIFLETELLVTHLMRHIQREALYPPPFKRTRNLR